MPPTTTESASPLEGILSPELAAAMAGRLSDAEKPSAAVTDTTPMATLAPSDGPPAIGDAAPAPPEPESLQQAGVSEGLAEALLLKQLLQRNTATSAQLAERSCLPRRLVSDVLGRLRDELLVTIKGQAGASDYVYQLTEGGHARGRQHAEHANYADAAPVPLAAYERAIRAQAIGRAPVTFGGLRAAMSDLTLGDSILTRLAEAVSDGRGLFLFGEPGNGKTTLAERLCAAFGKHLWIPRAVSVGSDILRLFDASCHEPVEDPHLESGRYDRRWVLIKRPTVVVGGELTLEQLDPSFHGASGVSEAPVQMKANGGTLVIDDFGRQRVSPTELLNRLIVPLEKRFDFLSLATGRQAQIPFELLFVLSTNLEPRELIDEAFLRRIPYKIEVTDPTLAQFHELFVSVAASLGLRLEPGVVDELLAEHYTPHNRPLRFCHPRDLLRQAKNHCVVHERPPVADRESLGVAVRNYFAGL